MKKEIMAVKIQHLQAEGFFDNDELVYWAFKGLMTYKKATLADMLKDAQEEKGEE